MFLPRVFLASSLALLTAAIVVGARQQSTQQQLPRDWRARFTKAALQIPFDSEQAPVPDSGLPPGAYPANVPRMTLALARTRDTGRVAGIESRITSSDSFPRLGIARGVNYVWREFVNDTLRQLVIPADTSKPVHWLAFSPHKHAPPKRGARLVVVDSLSLVGRTLPRSGPKVSTLMIGKCTPDCPYEPWCISRDTTSSRGLAKTAVSYPALQQYFARNKVVWTAR